MEPHSRQSHQSPPRETAGVLPLGEESRALLDEQKRFYITRLSARALVFIGPIFLLLNIIQGVWLLAAINTATTLLGATSLLLLRRARYSAGAFLLCLLLPLLFSTSGYLYRNGMEYIMLLTLMGAIFMFSSPIIRHLMALWSGLAFLTVRVLLFNTELPGLPITRYTVNLIVFLICYYWILELFRVINLNYQKAAMDKNQHLLSLTKELEEANQAKEKIFRIVSHDLRGPIVNLQSTVSLVSDGDLSTENFRLLLPQLQADIDSASHCLNTLLHWSSSQLSTITPVLGTVALQKVWDEALIQFAAPFARKEITLICDIPEGAGVHTDQNLLSIIVRNLVSNALKFTPSGGIVRLTTTLTQDGYWDIRITDTGVGIPSEKIADLLNPHALHTTRGTSNERGLGIGLGICHELLQTLGSNLFIESSNGKGSTFYFLLPAEAASQTSKLTPSPAPQ